MRQSYGSLSVAGRLLWTAAALLSIGTTTAQWTYLDYPEEVWRAGFSQVGIKNGLFATPDGDYVLAVANTGLVRAYESLTGAVAWTFAPTPTSSTAEITCDSGLFFNYESTTPYAVYAVTDTDQGISTCRVVLFDTNGDLYLQSVPLQGICAGTPTTTVEGRYIMVTHNTVDNQGRFTILDTTNSTAGVVPSFFEASDADNIFSPIGVYHEPEGALFGAQANRDNTYDIFIWATDTIDPGNSTPTLQGPMYGFQFPEDFVYGVFNASGTPLEMTRIGNNTRQWQASTPPVLANGGQNMYWSNTRGTERCWVETNFNRAESNRLMLDRGFPAWISAASSPALSNTNDSNPLVFGVGAGSYVWATNSDCSEYQVRDLDDVATSRPLVTLDDEYVVFGDSAGNLFATPTSNITDTFWSVGNGTNITLRTIQGDMAMSVSGDLIFVADSDGFASQIVALRIATPGPSPAPSTATPSASIQPTASAAPTSLLNGTNTPSLAPSPSTSGTSTILGSMTSAPSRSPVSDSESPTLQPTTSRPTPSPAPVLPGETPQTSSPTPIPTQPLTRKPVPPTRSAATLHHSSHGRVSMAIAVVMLSVWALTP